MKRFTHSILPSVSLLASACGEPYAVRDAEFAVGTHHGALTLDSRGALDESSRATDCQPTETIYYRGEIKVAQRCGGVLTIEGDIVVAEDDYSPENTGVAYLVRIQNDQYRWPRDDRGRVVVPYRIQNGFEALSEAAIVDAMSDLSAAVPSLSFREATSNDSFGLEFMATENSCSSLVGFSGKFQVIRLTEGCAQSHAAHHEILHSLGVYHEHTRKDRNQHVEIVWNAIRGCRGDAVSADDCGEQACRSAPLDCCTQAQLDDNICFMADNFATNGNRSDIGPYDYESVMHYSSGSFAKAGADATIVPLTSDDGTPVVGNRSHLSPGDISGLRALYPTLQDQRVFFGGTGARELCGLAGREADTATRWSLRLNGQKQPASAKNKLETTGLALGTHQAACSAESVFWQESYDYPNSKVDVDIDLHGPGDIEVADSGSFPIRVLNRGLLAGLL